MHDSYFEVIRETYNYVKVQKGVQSFDCIKMVVTMNEN